MKEFAIRLLKNTDLKKSIEEICIQNDFDTVIVLSAVGCLNSANIRLAGGKNTIEVKEDFEIVSLNGTISKGNSHLHISLSDEIGNCIGGHLQYGSFINTTCELVLGILEDYKSERIYDENTGYKEIVFKEGRLYD